MAGTSRGSRSLWARATLALLLMAGFYALALAIIVGLGFVVFLQARSGRGPIGITLIAVLGIVAILRGIIPRREKFVPPGPRVTSDDQPRLFQEIRRIAEATKSPMPLDVYIGADLNAAVAHVGGFFGIGARPIMIVGLPMIAALTVSELRGVLAHEFGHYVGGETRLAPVIYRTRRAIGRTINALARSEHVITRLMFVPFHLYGLMYLRTTLGISRRQELDADQMAARIAGGSAFESGLVKIHAAGLVLDAYMNGEIGGLLAAGYRPPIAEGFERFLRAEPIAAVLEKADEVIREGTSDPYDSHPSLKERLDALRTATDSPLRDPDPAATELLRNEPALEAQLLSAIGLDVWTLRPISWDEASTAYLDVWQKRCRDKRAVLDGITPEMLPLVCQDPASYADRIAAPRRVKRVNVLFSLIGAALTVILSRCGWIIEAAPGDPVTATLDGEIIMPFEVPGRLLRGELPAEEWLRTCREAGIAHVNLAEAGIKVDPRLNTASAQEPLLNQPVTAPVGEHQPRS
jgi:Zn-dependent protease with chaperone function